MYRIEIYNKVSTATRTIANRPPETKNASKLYPTRKITPDIEPIYIIRCKPRRRRAHRHRQPAGTLKTESKTQSYAYDRKHQTRHKNKPLSKSHAFTYNLKGRKQEGERPPFAVRKTAFYIAKDRLPYCTTCRQRPAPQRIAAGGGGHSRYHQPPCASPTQPQNTLQHRRRKP